MPVSRTEQLARDLLRHYLPRERFVYNSRPDWLRYPPTGRNLELDILLPDRIIAIEVDGVQHGRYIEGMQRSFADFVVQQRRDMHKREACKRRGVTLYKLTSFDLTQRRFEPFIRSLLSEAEWRHTTPPLHLYRQVEKLTRMKVVNHKCRKPCFWSQLLSRFRPLPLYSKLGYQHHRAEDRGKPW